MTTINLTPSAVPATGLVRPVPVGRKVALVATGLLTCALPTVFTVSITGMLLTGTESGHRFHQVTGQGLVLTALWLGALVPLLRAGWRGCRPTAAAGLRHVVLVLAGLACAAVSPGGGAPALVAVIGVPGALLWLALPNRPKLGLAFDLDALRAPVALAATAFLAPYAVQQIRLQNVATGTHAQNPHFFDMAWVSVMLMAFAVLAACFREARSLLGWVAGALVVFGAAGLAFGEGVAWSAVALGIGLSAVAVTLVRDRAGSSISGSGEA